MQCPKCGFPIKTKGKFCTNCGYAFKWNFKKIMILIISLFILGFVGLIVRSFIIEQEYLKPFSRELMFSETRGILTAAYNLEDKEITMNINLNQTIEQWQKNAAPKNSTAKFYIYLADKTLEYKSKPINLIVGNQLEIEYKIQDATIKNFARFKEYLDTSEFALETPNSLSADAKVRKQAYKDYIAEQERNRRANLARYHMRQLYMNGLISPYTYYGYY